MKAQAMVLRAFKQPLVPEAIEIPMLRPGEILVKLEASGICGSDVHMWQGEDPRTPRPIILGHEGVGRIAAMNGAHTTVEGDPVHEGDRILWNRGVTCGECFACKVLLMPWLCESRKVYGINRSREEAPYLNGCYSEYLILAPHTDLFLVEETVDPAILVSASCSGATAANAFDSVKINPGDTVVIQGPGPLGVFGAAFARNAGAEQVVVIGGSEERLALLREFGATHTINRRAYNADERLSFVRSLTHGRGADVVLEAAGSRGTAQESLNLVRPGGTCLMTGYAQPVGTEEIDFYSQVVRKHVTVRGIWVSDTRHTRQAIRLVLSQQEQFGKLITHRFALAEANEALEAMKARKALKAVLEFG